MEAKSDRGGKEEDLEPDEIAVFYCCLRDIMGLCPSGSFNDKITHLLQAHKSTFQHGDDVGAVSQLLLQFDQRHVAVDLGPAFTAKTRDS